RGRAAQRFDAHRGEAPAPARELATLGRCLAHVLVRRCPSGLTMAAHSAGRLREALPPRAPATAGACARGAGAGAEPAAVDDFLSGASGTVGGLDGVRRRA